MAIGNGKGRWPLFLGIAAAIILIIGTLHETQEHLPEASRKFWPFKEATAAAAQPAQAGASQQQYEGQSSNDEPVMQKGPPVAQKEPTVSQKEPSFFEIATKHGTDKVKDHSYQDMYDVYLPALRHKRIKMLEIGLGCDMSYGPGASYYTWLEYFPNVDLYFLEYNAECAAQWAHKTTGATIITGDQADGTTLEKIITDHGGDFDLIIDDGGHRMDQQKTSLEHLWKAVKPGGIYFCEDLQTSYWDNWGGGNAALEAGTITMMQYIQFLIEDLTWGPRRVFFPHVEEIVHIDCSKELCGFFRRKEPALVL